MGRRARASGKATTLYFAGFKQCLIIVVAKIYYVRGFALANITFITGNTRWHGFDNLINSTPDKSEGEYNMSFLVKSRLALTALFVLAAMGAWQTAVAEDIVKAMSGIVKSVDKGTRTMVVKASDGTEHTIKWTDKTTVRGAKDAGKGIENGSMDTYDGLKEGSKVSVKYTEKGGEKTAVAVKDASKATAKAATK